jgi:MFS family permease
MRAAREAAALALLAATQFLLAVDGSIVNVALPSIGRDLHVSPEELSWVVNAYVLSFGGFLLLGGRVADHLGRRRLYVAGASLAGALAQSGLWLAVARGAQGLGAALASPAALALLLALFHEGTRRNRALGVWAALGGSGGAAGAILAIEGGSRWPLVPLWIFANRPLRGANLVTVLTTGALFPMFFFLTVYTQDVLGYRPLQAALAQLPLAVTIATSATLAPRLLLRFGSKGPLVAGLAVVACGLGWFAAIPPDGSFLGDLLGPSLVVGAGAGTAWVASMVAATSGADPPEAGLASGLINTAQQLGGALGIAALVAVATARTTSVLGGGEVDRLVARTEGFQAGLLGGALVAVAGAALAAVLLSSTDGRRRPERNVMRPDIVAGATLPDYRLPDHTRTPWRVSGERGRFHPCGSSFQDAIAEMGVSERSRSLRNAAPPRRGGA